MKAQRRQVGVQPPKQVAATAQPKVPAKTSPKTAAADRYEGHEPEAAWDIFPHVAEPLRSSVTDAEKTAVVDALAKLKAQMHEAGLNYIPVFGYLSLRHDNFRELGLASQADVVPGRHTEEASLMGFDLSPLISTEFRGTVDHPGVAAGLAPSNGASTPGIVLKLPAQGGEAGLARLFEREFLMGKAPDGSDPVPVYLPEVVTVQTTEGRSIPALVFTLNPKSAYALDPDRTLKPSQLAWYMAGKGGFESPTGWRGGSSFDYWNIGYVKPRDEIGAAVDPVIREAMDLSRYAPSDAVVDALVAAAPKNPGAMRALDTLLQVFEGTTMSLQLRREALLWQGAPAAKEHATVDVEAEIAKYSDVARRLRLDS